jgi:hypothetical protein
MPPVENLVFEFASLGLGIVVLTKLWNNTNKFHFLGFVFAMLMAAAVELTGVRETSSYHYGEYVIYIKELSPVVLGWLHGTGRDVPLFVCVDWAIILFCAWRLGERLNNLQWYLIPFVFGLIAVVLDFGLDPIASASRIVGQMQAPCVDPTLPPGPTEGVGYWVWCIGPDSTEKWHGVPLGNSYGWFLVVYVFSLFYSWVYKNDYLSSTAVQFKKLFLATAASLILFFTLLHYLLWLNIGTSGWLLLGLLLVGGVIALVLAGKDRSLYTIDWWSLIAVVSIILASVGTYIYKLQGHPLLMVACGVCLIVSLFLTLWVMRGKHIFG